MADRVKRDVEDAQIAKLRLKHRDKHGVVDMSEGSPLHEDLTAWYEQQDLTIDYSRMALAATHSYRERHDAYRDMDKRERETGSLFADEGLISQSLDDAKSITMGEATQQQALDHTMVLDRQLTRQVSAHTRKKTWWLDRLAAYKSRHEKLRDVEKRLRPKQNEPGEDDQAQAAD